MSPKVEYTLTDFGNTLMPILTSIGVWEDEYQDTLQRVIIKKYPDLSLKSVLRLGI